MRKPLTCVALFVLALAVLITAKRVTADDPPGGNPALSWDKVDGYTDETSKSCGSSSDCFDKNCYDQIIFDGGITDESFSPGQSYPFGFCKTAPDEKVICHKLNSLRCAQVNLWVKAKCGSGGVPPFVKNVYVLNACSVGGPN